MADWNSRQYLKFAGERTQPAIDLANRIDAGSPKKILDIGCGPGNSTRVLAARFPGSYVLGVDNSGNMISAAKSDNPDLHFEVCDISADFSFLGSGYDVVFSNACIQWVPDHKRLLPRLMALLGKGGVLAVQIPMNYREPIHQIIGELSTSNKWKGYFENLRIFYTLTQSEYFDILSEISDGFNIWETTYYHVMKSHDDILEWYRGTGLRPYLDVLDEDRREQFEGEVMKRVVQSYSKQANGRIVFRFPRFFFTARA